jgi:peptidoglycan/LPS O-acetylase OafA/YrhL
MEEAMSQAAYAASARSVEYFDGIDLFRPIAAFGVVLLHVAEVFGTAFDPQFRPLLAGRDWAVPFFLVVSLFLLTRSLLGVTAREPNPVRSIWKRFRGLEVPFLFWTGAYLVVRHIVCPLVGLGAEDPIILSEYTWGFRHLWFLQFLFFASCVVVPVLWWLPEKRRRLMAYGWCALGLGVIGLAAIPLLRFPGAGKVNYVVSWLPLIPFSVGLACVHTAHRHWFTWDRLGLLGVLFAATGYALSATLEHTELRVWYRTLFGVGTVLIALAPWPRGWANFLRPVSGYSYAIYLTHMFVVFGFEPVFRAWGLAPAIADSALSLVLAGLVCFVASYLTAVVTCRVLTAVGLKILLPGRMSVPAMADRAVAAWRAPALAYEAATR